MNFFIFLNALSNLTNSGLSTILINLLLLYVIIIWISLIIWTLRDSLLRSKNFIFQLTSVLLVTLFNIFGLFIYLIIRPPLYLSEKELLNLNENIENCPKCDTKISQNFVYCPCCRFSLQSKCSKCKNFNTYFFSFCAVCGAKLQKKISS